MMDLERQRVDLLFERVGQLERLQSETDAALSRIETAVATLATTITAATETLRLHIDRVARGLY